MSIRSQLEGIQNAAENVEFHALATLAGFDRHLASLRHQMHSFFGACFGLMPRVQNPKRGLCPPRPKPMPGAVCSNIGAVKRRPAIFSGFAQIDKP